MVSGVRWCWLAVLSLAVSGCGGSSGTSEYEQMKQKEAGFAETIKAAGGSAKREGRSMGVGKMEGTGWVIDLSNAKITDDVLNAMIERVTAEPIFELNCKGSTLTDDQLAKLDAGKVLQKVFFLDLSSTTISDAGLDKCGNVHCLMELKLKGSKATKAGAKRLGDRKIAHVSTPQMFKTQPKVEL